MEQRAAEMQRQMEAEVAEIKRIESGKFSNNQLMAMWLSAEYKKVIVNKSRLQEKKSENEMVMAEFKMLDDDATVFKMVGPILAK